MGRALHAPHGGTGVCGPIHVKASLIWLCKKHMSDKNGCCWKGCMISRLLLSGSKPAAGTDSTAAGHLHVRQLLYRLCGK